MRSGPSSVSSNGIRSRSRTTRRSSSRCASPSWSASSRTSATATGTSRKPRRVPRIASVVFRGGGKVYQFDAGSLEVVPGDRVVVDTTRGVDFGRLVKGPDEVPPEQAPRGLAANPLEATQGDLDAVASHRGDDLPADALGLE